MRLPVDQLVEKYKDSVFRAAFSISRNPSDAEDIVQDTFLRYMESNRQFNDEEHIKAWLLRTAINQSKNVIRSFWRRKRVTYEEYMADAPFEEPGDRTMMEAVFSLPKAYRIVLYLYYYEAYSVNEAAEILGLPPGTVKSRLYRGRKLLKEALQDD